MADQKPSVLTSTRLPRAKGVNSLLLLKTAVANVLLGVCESFLNTRYFMQQTDGAGGILPAVEADVKTTEMGRVVTFPPITTPAASGTLTWLLVVQDLGSSLLCKSWDGTTQGATPIYVAKRPELRITIASQTIRGAVYNYSYASAAGSGGINYWTRSTTGGAATSELVIPDYLYGQEIYAVGIPSVTLDGNVCALMDTSGREWATQ